MTTYTGSITERYTTIHVDVNLVSQDQKQNRSVVSYRFYIKGKGNTGFWDKFHTGTADLYVNGGQHIVAKKGLDFDVNNGKTQVLAQGNFTVSHDNNGVGHFDFSAWMTAPASKVSGKVSATYSLPKIQRGATMSVSPSSANVGDQVTFNLQDTNSNYRYTIRYDMHGDKGTLVDKTSNSSYRWTIPASWGQKYLSNLQSSWATFYVDTYNGNTNIATNSTRLTVSIPNGSAPTIQALNLTEQNQAKINVFGAYSYYQLLSDIQAEAVIQTDYGAKVSSCQMTLGNQVESGTTVVFKKPDLTGDVSIRVDVVDSRGRSASRSFPMTLKPYKMPSINFFGVSRREGNDQIASSTVKLAFTPSPGSYNKNGLSLSIDLKTSDSNSWRTVHSATVNQSPYNYEPVIGNRLEAFQSYNVRLTIKDHFYSATALATLPASSLPLVIGATDPAVGIGKVPEIKKGLDIKGQLFVNGQELKTQTIPEITSGWSTNGRWVKFPDGTMICYKPDFEIKYYSFWHLKTTWVYPQKFTNQPTISITNYNLYNRDANNGSTLNVEKNDGSSALIELRSNMQHQDYKNSDSTRAMVMAIGVWK
ncbi:MAG: DUF859 family phage minor structural protein [Aerococcus sp.]|nr:DUF859 family phage minor structural protein [Aerococcus sp.]